MNFTLVVILVNGRVILVSISFAGNSLYSWVERSTAVEKCLVQGHHTTALPRAARYISLQINEDIIEFFKSLGFGCLHAILREILQRYLCLLALATCVNFICWLTMWNGLLFVFQDLSKLGRDLKHVLIVDNSPASYSFHPENAVSDDICLTIYFM